MDFREIGKWEHSGKTEIYYDKIFRHYIVKNKSVIEVKPLGVRASFIVNMDKSSKDLCTQQFTHLCINVPRSLICSVSEDNSLLLFRYNSFKSFKLLPDKSKFLGVHFLSSHYSDCFLFIVSTSGLFLYKTNSTTSSVTLIKSFQLTVSDYSFEESEGILVLVSPQGQVFVYDLYQQNGSRYFQISTFDLIYDKGSTRQVSSGAKAVNLMAYVNRLDLNQVKLALIYKKLFFLHLDNLTGRLYLFALDNPQLPSLYAAMNVGRGLFAIGISENLLTIMNYNTQETLFFDIQNQINDYLAKVSHSDTAEDSSVISAPFRLTPDVFFVDDEILADLQAASLKNIDLRSSELIECNPDEVKSIKFLLRRVNCKIKVLEKIKKSIMNLLPLKQLEIIFKSLGRSYQKLEKDTEYETNSKKQAENSEHLEEGHEEVNLNIEMKNDSGITVLLQSDLYFCVFAPVYKEINDFRYFAEVLYSFMHFLMELSVDVHLSIQYLFFKVLVKNAEFVKIQKLVEIKFFNDSQDIALFLTSLGKTETIKGFPNCFNLGIDMLNRLKLFELVAQELADQEYYFETLEVIGGKMICNLELRAFAEANCGFLVDF